MEAEKQNYEGMYHEEVKKNEQLQTAVNQLANNCENLTVERDALVLQVRLLKQQLQQLQQGDQR